RILTLTPCRSRPCSLRLRGATAFVDGRHHRSYRVSCSYLFCASSSSHATGRENRNQGCPKSICRRFHMCRLSSENCRDLSADGNGPFIHPSDNQQHSRGFKTSRHVLPKPIRQLLQEQRA